MQNIRVLDTGLDIIPNGDQSGTHFTLHNLKNVLPNVIVNVISAETLSRIYILLRFLFYLTSRIVIIGDQNS